MQLAMVHVRCEELAAALNLPSWVHLLAVEQTAAEAALGVVRLLVEGVGKEGYPGGEPVSVTLAEVHCQCTPL